MYISKDILESQSLLEKNTDEIFSDFLKNESIYYKSDKDYQLFAVHPWQANT